MNTLVIGNGFDLAHGYPTQYKDFMNFFQLCEIVIERKSNNANTTLEEIEKNYSELWEKLARCMQNTLQEIDIKAGNINSIVPQYMEEYYSEGKRNCWYEYYKALLRNDDRLVRECIRINGDNWVDFEKEISRVIEKIEKDETIEMALKDGVNVRNIGSRIDLQTYMDEKGEGLITYIRQRNVYFFNMDKFIKYLRKELDVFINFMDEYIKFIELMDNHIEVEDFVDEKGKALVFDRVIIFNYTDIFRMKYRKLMNREDNINYNGKIEFVHGKAGEIHGEYISNLVLGCEETLPDFNASKDTRCAYFKKYMQREVKNTARKYTRFYDDSSPIDNTAYFFGHSLDVNDGDIIREVIKNNNRIVIYYYDYDACIQQTQNLIKILGKDKYLVDKWKFENRAMINNRIDV
ncbi:hypothetical protein D081_1177 [Anaerovibrio sp. JC8]|uniref:AbiH family protein n=1 Tax=Anaerovibrio sp. JC8 TaxID=1240085 RepID=UPI000A0A4169|nr:AbiH family protein [Anaerovibrio sp. JC8]ORU00083.1 hypothetical protein D081_1177 [Anaerovibrio sp. JC8]